MTSSYGFAGLIFLLDYSNSESVTALYSNDDKTDTGKKVMLNVVMILQNISK